MEIDPEIEKMQFFDILKLASADDEDAFEYLKTMCQIFRLWDDVYDQDRVVDKNFANDIFCEMALGIKGLFGNKFYQKNHDALDAFVFVAYNAWMDSNLWKSENGVRGVCAWFIRDFVNELEPLVAFLVKGRVYARKISPVIREWNLNRLNKQGIDDFFDLEKIQKRG